MVRFQVLAWLVSILICLCADVESQTAPLRPCRVSSDCNINRPCSLDYCPPFSKVCLNVNIGRGNCPGTDPLTTKPDIIAKLNADLDFTTSAKLRLIDVATTLLEEIHPHRNFHLRFLRYDPVRALSQFRKSVLQPPGISNADFHAKMLEVFLDLDDAHTQYTPPSPLADSAAFLPFSISEFFDPPRRAVKSSGRGANTAARFVVHDIASGFAPTERSFTVGVEIVEWNGQPIQVALRRASASTYGANEFAKFRVGLEALTSRALPGQPIPEEDFVEIGYIDRNGRRRTISVDWVYVTLRESARNAPNSLAQFVRSAAVANMSLSATEMRSMVGLDQAERLELRTSSAQILRPGARRKIDVNPALKLIFDAEIIGTSSGTFGMIRIFTYNIPDFGLFAAEYTRLLNLLPSAGLVIDIRGNTGGFTELEYLTLLLVSNRTYNPITADVRVTPFTEDLSEVRGRRQDNDLASFERSIDSARVNGATFSTDQVLVPIERFLQVQGQAVRATIVLTDGSSYSAGDGVASSAKDNGLAVVVGIDGATGGGGSVTVQYDTLRAILPRSFPALPGSATFSVSLFRSLRVGPFKGVTYEYFGVEPNLRYFPTYADRLQNDRDLIEFLGEKLSKLGRAAAAEIARGNPV